MLVLSNNPILTAFTRINNAPSGSILKELEQLHQQIQRLSARQVLAAWYFMESVPRTRDTFNMHLQVVKALQTRGKVLSKDQDKRIFFGWIRSAGTYAELHSVAYAPVKETWDVWEDAA